jgi:hypothetical protein
VIIYETDDNKVYVSAMNPVSVLGVLQNKKLRIVAKEVSTKLQKVIENVAKKHFKSSDFQTNATF